MPVADPTVVDALVAVILILVAVMVENRFGLRKRTGMIWHKIVNSETYFKIDAVYDTDMVFENVRDEVKSVFREHYGDITILEDGSGSVTLEVNDNFLVTLGLTDDDEVSIETSKITSTMRDMRTEIDELLQVIGDFEERSHNVVKGTDNAFEDNQFTAELFLPYNSTFVNMHLPRGVTLTSYRLTLDYPDYDCSIQDTGESLNITTDHREDLHTILNRLLKTWAIWWKRMK